MAESVRPLRADAARNRARLLEVAYETFAAEGLAVPIDEIARRAGVGAGTVYRHFPTKDDLFRAIVDNRLRRAIDEGHALLQSDHTGEALFIFLRWMVVWGATDRGLVDALAGAQFDIKTAAPQAEEAFLTVLGELLDAAQRAGTARADVGVPEVKALMVGCQAMQSYTGDTGDRLTSVVLDGLRRSTAGF